MSELKELIDGYIRERDDARQAGNQGWNQAAQWRAVATALAIRNGSASSSYPPNISTFEMETAGDYNLEVIQLKKSIKLVLTPIEEEDTDGGS